MGDTKSYPRKVDADDERVRNQRFKGGEIPEARKAHEAKKGTETGEDLNLVDWRAVYE